MHHIKFDNFTCSFSKIGCNSLTFSDTFWDSAQLHVVFIPFRKWVIYAVCSTSEDEAKNSWGFSPGYLSQLHYTLELQLPAKLNANIVKFVDFSISCLNTWIVFLLMFSANFANILKGKFATKIVHNLNKLSMLNYCPVLNHNMLPKVVSVRWRDRTHLCNNSFYHHVTSWKYKTVKRPCNVCGQMFYTEWCMGNHVRRDQVTILPESALWKS